MASARSTTSTTYLTEFRRKSPRARIPETAFLEPCFLTKAENTIIDNMLELLNKHKLTSHQPQHLFERLGQIIEMGQRVLKGADRAIHALPLTMFADFTANVTWGRG